MVLSLVGNSGVDGATHDFPRAFFKEGFCPRVKHEWFIGHTRDRQVRRRGAKSVEYVRSHGGSGTIATDGCVYMPIPVPVLDPQAHVAMHAPAQCGGDVASASNRIPARCTSGDHGMGATHLPGTFGQFERNGHRENRHDEPSGLNHFLTSRLATAMRCAATAALDKPRISLLSRGFQPDVNPSAEMDENPNARFHDVHTSPMEKS